MVASRAHDAVMVNRFKAARRLNNAVLGDGLEALALMRESKAWTTAKSMQKGEPKRRCARCPQRRIQGLQPALWLDGICASGSGHSAQECVSDPLTTPLDGEELKLRRARQLQG